MFGPPFDPLTVSLTTFVPGGHSVSNSRCSQSSHEIVG